MKTNSFKDLIVWQKAMELVNLIYQLSNLLPAREQYILISQMLRAAISIPSNIAEGHRRNHKPEFIQFLSIAFASAAELETQLLICQKQYTNIKYNYEFTFSILTEVQKILFVMLKNLKTTR